MLPVYALCQFSRLWQTSPPAADKRLLRNQENESRSDDRRSQGGLARLNLVLTGMDRMNRIKRVFFNSACRIEEISILYAFAPLR